MAQTWRLKLGRCRRRKGSGGRRGGGGGEGGGGSGCNRRHVDAAAPNRTTNEGESGETPQKVAGFLRKVWDTVRTRCTGVKVNFVDEHGAVLVEIRLGKVTERQHPASDS